MSRIYDKTEDGGSYLHAIRCDGVGCLNEHRPYPEIWSAGRRYEAFKRTHVLSLDYCPDCEANPERRR
jgi:hypothetical protein